MDGPGAQQWSPAITTKFIALYRDHPCLWKVTDKSYLNRNLKTEAYRTLVNECKKHFPEANRDFVSKKIQNLRGSFRKELKKVNASKRSGSSADDVYIPKLWYYDLLSFTADCETPTDSIENFGTDGTPEIQEKELSALEDTPRQGLSTETGPPLTKSSEKPEISKSKETKTSKKARKRSLEESQLEFMQTCSKARSESTDFGEFDAVGILVSKKLRRMSPQQALLAEDIINRVLSKGLRNQLSANTDFFERVQTTDNEWSRSSFASNEFSRSSWPRPSHSPSPSPLPPLDQNPQQNNSQHSSFFPDGLYDEYDQLKSQTFYTSLSQ